MKTSKIIVLGLCTCTSLSLFQGYAHAADGARKYDRISTEANASYDDSVQFKNMAGSFWKELSRASFSLDSDDYKAAQDHIDNARMWLRHISQLSENHAVKVRVRGARVLYQKGDENFEYFFPVNDEGELNIDEAMLLAIRDQDAMAARDIEIGRYRLQIDPAAVEDRLETVRKSLDARNAVEARTHLDALEQGLFISQETADDVSPQQDAVDWIDLGLVVMHQNRFDTLHFVLEKIRDDLGRMKQNETDFSPKQDIYHLRQRLDDLVLQTPQQLREDKVGLGIEMGQWKVTLHLDPQG